MPEDSSRIKGFIRRFFPHFDQDARLTLAIISSFALGILIYLSIFDLAGRFGGILGNFVVTIFGRGSFFLPLVFFVAGVTLIKIQKNSEIQEAISTRVWWGLFIMFLAFSGFLNLVTGVNSMEQVSNGGGVIGYVIYPLSLHGVFGEVGGVFMLVCMFVVGFFLVSQMTISEFLQNTWQTFRNPKRFWDFIPDIFEIWRKEKVSTSDQDRPVENRSEKKDKPLIEEAGELYKKLSKPKQNKPKLMSLPGEVKNPMVNSEKKPVDWQLPAFDILRMNKSKVEPVDIEGNKNIIKETLNNFGIEVQMKDVVVGPTVTQYTFKPSSGVRLSTIDGLQRDIALALAAPNIRIESPIAGKSLVGIEVPNSHKAQVGLRDLLQTHEFLNYDKDLPIAIGKDVSGENIIYPLSKMPHLLVAGATGSGKSVFINGLLLSLLYRYTPDELHLILVDMKRVELKLYEGVPHLLAKVITEAEKAINALKWTVLEMDRRYKILEEHGKRNIVDYNRFASKEGEEELPYLVFIIDELGDLMMLAKSEVEPIIVRLTQMARAVGIHLVLGTQRPDIHVVTGLIKANVPSRIAFAVASQVDSRVILDSSGAEKLLGQGDGLLVTPSSLHPSRFQGPNVEEAEVKKCVIFLKKQVTNNEIRGNIREEVVESPKSKVIVPGMSTKDSDDDTSDEDIYDRAKRLVIQHQKASTSFLQQMLGVGYPKASKIIYKLEEDGVVGPANGSKSREVYLTQSGGGEE